MIFSPVTDLEMELIEAAVAGDAADFRNRKGPSGILLIPTIRAEVLRRLLIGLPLPVRARDPSAPLIHHTVAGSGIALQGAHILGAVNLADCQPNGGACPPLLLEDCLLLGNGSYGDPAGRPAAALDLRHARVARLSVKNCRCGFIDLTDASLMGDLDLDGLQALHDEGQCRVEAVGVRIEGTLRAPDAKLRLKQDSGGERAKRPDYALNLLGAQISGSVLLRPGFVADGGISVSRAKIAGDFWADGARLVAQGNYALQGQSVHVEGLVGLTCLHARAASSSSEHSQQALDEPERFTAEGTVSFGAADLGSLLLTGAHLRPKAGEEENWFIGDLATIRHSLYLDRWKRNQAVGSADTSFEAEYDLWLRGAKIAGSIEGDGAKLRSFYGDDLEIGGSLVFTGIEARRIHLPGIKVRGDLDLGRLMLLDERDPPELNLERSEIARRFKIDAMNILEVELPSWSKASPLQIFRKRLVCYRDLSVYIAVYKWKEKDAEEFSIVSLALGELQRSPVLLDGKSDTIRRLNRTAGLMLDTAERAAEYLKFFCAYVWAEEGRFRIVEAIDEIRLFARARPNIAENMPEALTPKRAGATDSWSVDAVCLVYGKSLYKAAFRISLQGEVEMLADELLAELPEPVAIRYLPPLEIITGPLAAPASEEAPDEVSGNRGPMLIPPPFGRPGQWVRVAAAEFSVIEARVLALVESRKQASERPDARRAKVVLRSLKAGSLDDQYGDAWGDQATLDLDGFVYERFEGSANLRRTFKKSNKGSVTVTTSETWKHRLAWLGKQYTAAAPLGADTYRSQPYEQVSKALGAQGDYDGSAHVLVEKLRAERKSRPQRWKRIGLWILNEPFGYFVRWQPALRTFVIFWILGWICVDFANYGRFRWLPSGWQGASTVSSRPVLLVDAAPVSALALTDNTPDPKDAVARAPATALPGGGFVTEMRCGDAIEPALYALDVFVPLLDLRQESKCEVSSARYAMLWRLLKSAYAILGWISTSALLLTISGLVRREIERKSE